MNDKTTKIPLILRYSLIRWRGLVSNLLKFTGTRARPVTQTGLGASASLPAV